MRKGSQRDFLASVSVQTLEIAKCGFYQVGEEEVSFEKEMEYAIDNSALYRPDDLPRQILDNTDNFAKGKETTIEVRQCTTLAALLSLDNGNADVVALNFASAKNPGGGFLKGALAQEESLARATGLYRCLTTHRVGQFYEDNSKDRTCLYTHNIIYSPLVPVFRDDAHELLSSPKFVSFISAPAINATHALQRVDDPVQVFEVMESRMERVLAVAALNNQNTLVLGAWGCGVFGNDTTEIALMWRHFLIEGKFSATFSNIIFAITDENTVKIFENILDRDKPLSSLPRSNRSSAGRGNSRGRGGGGGRGGGRGKDRGFDRKQANVKKHNYDPETFM